MDTEPKGIELRLAGEIKATVDEIMRRITCLPTEEKNGTSSYFRGLLDLLTSVINEDTVLQAISFVENKNVKLLTFLSDEEKAKLAEMESGPKVKEERISMNSNVPQPEERSTLDLFEEDEMDFDPNETMIDLDFQVKEELKSCNEEEIEVKKEVKSQKSMKVAKHFSDNTVGDDPEDVKEFQVVTVIRPVFDLSMCAEDELIPPEIHRGLRFYEITPPRSLNSVFVIPEVNYCRCEFFQKYVLDRRVEFTCAHVLASWLSAAMGTTKIVDSRLVTLDIIARQFAERTYEFY